MEPDNLTLNEGVSGTAGGGRRRRLIAACGSALGLILLVGVGLWIRPLVLGQIPVNADAASVQTTGAPPEAPDQDGPTTAAAEEVGFSAMNGAGDGAAGVSMGIGELEVMTQALDGARHVLGNAGAEVTVVEFSDFL